MNPIIVIPARMAATRLPGKPLADLAGRPLILRVMDAARAADIGPVVVAAGDAEIAEAVQADGGRAVLTPPDLASGSDRVNAALAEIDPEGTHDLAINLQGDEPDLPQDALRRLAQAMAADAEADIGTAVAPDPAGEAAGNPHMVKAVLAERESGPHRVLYFSRAAAPHGDGPLWRHVGLYAYRRPALERFCALPPSPLERRERLEQLRALEAGMRFCAIALDAAPEGIDTPADLERAQARWAARAG